MAACKNCNAELKEGSKFCPYCGTRVQAEPVVEPVIEPVAEPVAETVVEPVVEPVAEPVAEPVVEPVAEPVVEPVVEPVAETVVEPTPVSDETQFAPVPPVTPAPEKKKKKKGGMIALFVILGLLLLALLAGGIILITSLIFGGSSELPDYTLFYQDGQLYYWDFDSNNPLQVTTALTDETIDDDDVQLFANITLSYACKINQDGDRLFYPDKNDDYDDFKDGYNLYYRNPNKPKEEPVKIDSDVTSFDIDPDGNKVVYVKDGGLYEYNVKKEERYKIAPDAEQGFVLSPDGNRVIYMNEDGDLYFKDADADKEKLAAEVNGVEYLSDDLSVIYYQKDGSLYKQVVGEEREKIVSEYANIVKVYENGEVYFTKSEEYKTTLAAFLDDDMLESDQKQTEPVEPVRPTAPVAPSYWDYDVYEEYIAACDQYSIDYQAYQELYNQYLTECDEYDALYEEYRKVLRRNDMRNDINTQEYVKQFYSLYCVKNGEETKLADKLTTQYSYGSATENATIYFKTVTGEPAKIKMSDLFENDYYNYIGRLRNSADDAFNSSASYRVAVGTTVSAIEQKDAFNITFTPDGSAVYYSANLNSEDNTCDLYKAEIKDGKLQSAALYDSDICSENTMILNNKIVYFKDYKDGKGDLYINKEKIDYDVAYSRVTYSEENDSFLYYTDWNSEKYYGTLKKYDGKTSIKIADDVRNYTVIPSGKILYLNDYSTTRHKGTLYYYENDESIKIAEDVVAEFQCAQ